MADMNWLRRLKNWFTPTPARRQPRRLTLEQLDGRIVPAVLDQLRIVNYNVLNVPDASALMTVLEGIGDQTYNSVRRPIDVLLLQEVNDSNGGQAATVLNVMNTIYGGGTYSLGSLQQTQGSGDQQAIVYRNSTVNLLGEFQVPGGSGPRAPMRYHLSAVADPSADFYVYNSHFDASDAADRLDEAQAIRNNADGLGQGAEILYVGDFNIRSSNTGMYQELTSSGSGQAFDPINAPGIWNNRSEFSYLHTQSTRTSSGPGGGATGGMDDRFDFILHSGEVGASGTSSDSDGLEYRAGSYRAFGNDDTHAFNGAVTSGAGIYSATVRSALLTASDHLPVVADYNIVGEDAGGTQEYNSTGSVGIFDQQWALSEINVTGSGTVADLDASVDISHTYVSDLTIYLQAPDGSYIVLANRLGGSGNNYDTIFDDEAANSVTTASAPFSGRLRPQQSLSAFDGKNITGTWRLWVYDHANFDTGSIDSWSLNFQA